MKVLIIGGVAGGATAAARLRRLDENAEIVIVERSHFISYANCGLPYFVGGKITERRDLTLQTPQSFFRRFRIDVRVRNEALAIDSEAKKVRIRDLETGREYEESYDRLILSPGAKPFMPDTPGMDTEKVFTIRTVEDTFRIYEYIEREKVGRAAIIGGGFIGLEMAENLKLRGIDVTLLQRSAHVMPPLDGDMAKLVHANLIKNGIDLRLNTPVSSVEDVDRGLRINFRDGGDMQADILIMAVGVVPESDLAKMAGLETGIKGAIKTNARMETSVKDIYAVGDAVEVEHFVTGEAAVISLAGPANKQGRIAADNICGIGSTYKGSQGSSILKLFHMTVASTGLNEKKAQAAGIDYDYVVTSGMSHATYYPGAEEMMIKILFEKETGRIIGGQIIGGDGADKRIDVLATAIRARMTAWDLTELDLAYAPPYSSAKDPLNMAGYVMENILEGRIDSVHWDDVLSAGDDCAILDVRTEYEVRFGTIEGAVNIPVDSLRDRIGEVPQGKKLLVFCHSGLRSYVACRILSQLGYDCANVSGGYAFYRATR